MAVLTTVTFATFFLENDHFLTLYEGNEYFSVNFSTFNGRSSDLYVAVGIEKENFVECNGFAFFHLIAEMMNIQILALFGFELLSFNFYNCVHWLI